MNRSTSAEQTTELVMKNVVVGFDGSDESRDALLLAKQFAGAEDATLHVAVVQWDWEPDQFPQRFASLFSQARRELGAQQFVEQPLKNSSAAEALHDLADELQPDLIVLGSTHRGKAGRILIGSVGERLLHGAPCSVAVAPRGYAEREHFGAGVIGVGYDDTAESKLALQAAVELARVVGGSLRLIAVVPHFLTPGRIGGTDVGYSRVVREDLEAALEDAARSIDGVEVETVIEEGDVVDELANQAVELDLLVVGSRGYGPIRRVLLGGVSTAMTRTSPSPLLVTPRSSEAREATGALSAATE